VSAIKDGPTVEGTDVELRHGGSLVVSRAAEAFVEHGQGDDEARIRRRGHPVRLVHRTAVNKPARTADAGFTARSVFARHKRMLETRFIEGSFPCWANLRNSIASRD
jgi:hypothetical protein